MPRTKSKSKSKKSIPLWAWGVAAIIVIGGIGVFIFRQLNSRDQSYPLEISVATAAVKRNQGAFILDVRQPEEWAQFHIPGATLIPLGDLPSRINEVPKYREVIVVCRTGVRSAKGRDILRNAGYTQVTSITGGITQWQAQGQPITTGE